MFIEWMDVVLLSNQVPTFEKIKYHDKVDIASLDFHSAFPPEQ